MLLDIPQDRKYSLFWSMISQPNSANVQNFQIPVTGTWITPRSDGQCFAGPFAQIWNDATEGVLRTRYDNEMIFPRQSRFGHAWSVLKSLLTFHLLNNWYFIRETDDLPVGYAAFSNVGKEVRGFKAEREFEDPIICVIALISWAMIGMPAFSCLRLLLGLSITAHAKG